MDYFVKNFHEILGVKPGEKVNILTPQFEREYELEIDWEPESVAEFNTLKSLPKEVLKKMGIRIWDKDEKTNEVYYLYPGEWFNIIPEGYPIVDIWAKDELFSKETSGDDIRFGCLAYGFMRIENETPQL